MEWVHTPVGLNADRWVTRRGCRTVLVMVHSLTCGQRLMDVVELLRCDTRVQLLFTPVPGVLDRGVREWLADLGAVVLPWEQAQATQFDLALTATYGRIAHVHAPIVVVPHGAGYNKVAPQARIGSGPAPRETFGLDRHRLIHDGRVVPAALVLAHEKERHRLARSCPEAVPVPVAVVAGDPCADRLAVSLGERELCRGALGLGVGERLVVAASTWGPRSLLGSRPDVISRMVQEVHATAGWRAALLVHPNVWAAHGAFQVRAWMSDWRASGLLVVPVGRDWVPVLAAADAVIGDHGSSTLYGSLLGRPLMVSDGGADDVDPESPMGELLRTAPRVAPAGPVLDGVESLSESWRPDRLDGVAAQITSYPGAFAARMRSVLYGVLMMAEPAGPPMARGIDMLGLGGDASYG